MVEAANQNGMYLMIGHNQRLAKAYVTARKLIEAGLIGDIVTFRNTFGHDGPETWSVEHSKNTWFFDISTWADGTRSPYCAVE